MYEKQQALKRITRICSAGNVYTRRMQTLHDLAMRGLGFTLNARLTCHSRIADRLGDAETFARVARWHAQELQRERHFYQSTPGAQVSDWMAFNKLSYEEAFERALSACETSKAYGRVVQAVHDIVMHAMGMTASQRAASHARCVGVQQRTVRTLIDRCGIKGATSQLLGQGIVLWPTPRFAPA